MSEKGLSMDRAEVTEIMEAAINTRGNKDIIRAIGAVLLTALTTIAVLKSDMESLKTGFDNLAGKIDGHVTDHARGVFEQ